MKKNEENLIEIWDTIKNNSMNVLGIPEEERKVKTKQNKKYSKKMTEYFPTFLKTSNLHISEAKPINRHITVKMIKVKHRTILKTTKEK